MRLACLIGLLALIGCSGGSQMPQTNSTQPDFSFTVEEVFYIKPPVDRVILVGTIEEGSINVGDSLTVRCKSGDIPVVLEGIETLERGPVESASKSQQVGLKLKGIRKDQAGRGDRVVANPT
jgi:translation elongation factor EF-Tu-like GTPase